MTPTAEPLHNATATCRDEGTLMATLGITQAPGPYIYGGHRYDKLLDAVQYAQRHHAASPPSVTVQVVKTGITPQLATSDRLREAKTEPLHPAGRLHMLQ